MPWASEDRSGLGTLTLGAISGLIAAEAMGIAVVAQRKSEDFQAELGEAAPAMERQRHPWGGGQEPSCFVLCSKSC
jgi:hypothetical protein